MRKRQTDIQTDRDRARQTDRQTETERDRQTDRDRDRERQRDRDRGTERERGETDRQTDRQTDIETERDKDKDRDSESDRQTDRQTESGIGCASTAKCQLAGPMGVLQWPEDKHQTPKEAMVGVRPTLTLVYLIPLIVTLDTMI